jgi:Flp pilus assembly protein TadD
VFAAKRDRRPWWVCVLLVVAAVCTYWPVFHCGFVNYDDVDYVSENFMVQRGLTLDGLAWAFTTDHAANWHPLTWLSHMLDCQLFGLKPYGPHAVNLLFHTLNSLLLFGILKQMTGALWRSAFVAALFALHPLHVESVAWISERKDVLSTFFGFLALGTYARYTGAKNSKFKLPSSKPDASCNPHHTTRYYWLSLIFFALGLLSKPMLVTLPFVLLLLDYWPLRRTTSSALAPHHASRITQSPNPQPSTFDSRLLIRLLVEKVPFFALAVASSVVTFLVQRKGGAVADFASVSFAPRLGNALISYLRYLKKMAWPNDLAIAYPPVEWFVWQEVGAALILVALTILLLRARRPYLVTGWLWFLGVLFPVIGVVAIGSQSMADRYSYVSLIGIFLMLSWGAAEVWACRRVSSSVLAGVSVAVLLALAGRTFLQVRYWQGSVSLFTHALTVTEHNTVAHSSLGAALLQEGRTAEAKSHLISALQFSPRFAEAHYHLGLLLLAEGQLAEGIAHWKNARDIKPGWVSLNNNLAWTLATCRDPVYRNPVEAVRLSEYARASDPHNPSIYDTLAAAYAEAGRFPEALIAIQKAIALAEALRQFSAAARFHDRLDLYQTQKPYHQP